MTVAVMAVWGVTANKLLSPKYAHEFGLFLFLCNIVLSLENDTVEVGVNTIDDCTLIFVCIVATSNVVVISCF